MPPSSPDGKEQRSKKRYGVKDSALCFGKQGLIGIIIGKSKPYLILNLSEKGLHFICPTELMPGSNVSLEISAPMLKAVVKCQAKVSWCTLGRTENAYRIGLEFTKIAKASQQRLKHLLDNTVLDRVDVTTTMYFKESKKLRE